jgi:hypothetical protein
MLCEHFVSAPLSRVEVHKKKTLEYISARPAFFLIISREEFFIFHPLLPYISPHESSLKKVLKAVTFTPSG